MKQCVLPAFGLAVGLLLLAPTSGTSQPPEKKESMRGDLKVGERSWFIRTGENYSVQGFPGKVIAIDGDWVKVEEQIFKNRHIWINLHNVGAIWKATTSLTPLDAVLRVKVDSAKLEPTCQFQLPGKADQSFENTEYRYAVLDKDGVQVEEALTVQLPIRTISLPKINRSVTDATDAKFVKEKLKSGEEYYFVVSVRNLTGLAKFKAP